MRKRAHDIRIWILIVALPGVVVACSKAERNPPPQRDGRRPATLPKAEGSVAALDALTREKTSDQDYAEAIATLEKSDAAADVEAVLKVNEPRLLGIPRPGAASMLPGVEIPRERLPEKVEVARIAGFSQIAANKYQQRFQMLASRYATEYNAQLLRRLR